MKRGLSAFCLALGILFTASCRDKESLPDPIVGSDNKGEPDATAAPAGSVKPAADSPSSCTPTAGEACFAHAEFEHAVVLLHHVTGASVVVVGSYDAQINARIPTANAAIGFAGLAAKAELAHREIGGVHYIGAPDVINRAGVAGGIGFCRERKTMVAERMRAEDFAKQVVEENGRRLVGEIDGEITVALADQDACAVVSEVIRMGAGRKRVDNKALRVDGDVAVPKSTRAAGSVCAPLDSKKVLRQPCHANADLGIVGVSLIDNAPVAVVRRIGRVYEPVDLVRVGEHVGDLHDEVASIDASGLRSKLGNNVIVGWSP